MLNDAKKHIGQLPHDFRVDSTTSRNVSGVDTEYTIDFEILTEIQHYEGKTNLIDFSTDYFIALFFACDGSPDEDGRVILQKSIQLDTGSNTLKILGIASLHRKVYLLDLREALLNPKKMI